MFRLVFYHFFISKTSKLTYDKNSIFLYTFYAIYFRAFKHFITFSKYF